MLSRMFSSIIIFLILNSLTLFSQEMNKSENLQLEKSLKMYRTICSIESDNYAAFNNIGNIYFLKGFLDSAEVSYLHAKMVLKDSLKAYDETADRKNYKRIYRHLEGINLNLGTLYTAADSLERAYEMYSTVVKDSTDIKRVKILLGLPVEKKDYTLAKKPDISATKVKYMISKTAEKGKDKKKDQPKDEKSKGKKKSKGLVRKGTKPEGKITDVFYWINEL